MSNKLGILEVNGSRDQDSLVKGITENCEYELVNIKSEDQLERIEGLIISAYQETDYIEVCEWLVALRSRQPLFVWILCEECDSYTENLYYKLATNSIVEVVKSDKDNQYLCFKIKKAIDFQVNLLAYKRENVQGKLFYLDSQNLKLIVDDKKISLTKSEFKLFSILSDQIGNAVSYEKLIELIWSDFDEMNYKYRLANLVFNVRKKLKRQSCVELEIVRTKGYLLKLK